jgi:hypothetical protein
MNIDQNEYSGQGVQTIVFRGLQTPQRWAKWGSPIVFRGWPASRRRPPLP